MQTQNAQRMFLHPMQNQNKIQTKPMIADARLQPAVSS